jgi:sugar phosphate isomerase/epimerase
MKKAIGDNMISKDWGFEKGLELVKQAGFHGIELWLGDVPWFQMSTPDAEVRALRRKIAHAGLVMSNVSTGLHWASPRGAARSVAASHRGACWSMAATDTVR